MDVGGERVFFRDVDSSTFHSTVGGPDPCAYGKTTGDQWEINNKQNKIKLEEDHVNIYT